MKDWQKQKILDLYIHDYLERKKMKTTADILAQEAGIQVKPVALDEGFLEDFWSIFWDVYVSRLNKNPQPTKPETPEPSDLSAISNLTGTRCPVMESLLQEEMMMPNEFEQSISAQMTPPSELPVPEESSMMQNMCITAPIRPAVCNPTDKQNPVMGSLVQDGMMPNQSEQSISDEEIMRYYSAQMPAESGDGSRAQNGARWMLNHSKLQSISSAAHDPVVQPNVVDLTSPEPDFQVTNDLPMTSEEEQILRHLGFSQDEISEWHNFCSSHQDSLRSEEDSLTLESMPRFSNQTEMDIGSVMMMRPNMEFNTCQFGQTSGKIQSQDQMLPKQD